jgi:Tfp pilus assembly protein PilX
MREHKGRNKRRNRESGMALLIALLALLLVSAIGMGMMYMSSTETSINANYRDTQQAFFAMRAGLEEMRDRMRTNAPSGITLPTSMPSSGAAGSVVYILNPTGSETVDPVTYSANNKYFDDEFCHETFTGITYTGVTTGVPCTGTAQAPPSTAVTTIASIAPYTGTSSALSYKWVRITLKQNGSFPTALVAPIDASHPASGQICWDAGYSREIVSTSLGATYTTCLLAQQAGYLVAPVYVLTSLAYTPQGSRRIGQYEVAAVDITPPPAGLSMAGAGANIPSAPNSNNFVISGNDTGVAGYTGTPACRTTAVTASVPAIVAGDQAGQNTIADALPRPDHYTGSAPTPALLPPVPSPIPSVVDGGASPGTGQLNGLWNSPQQLNNLVAMIGAGADYQLSCGIAGSVSPLPAACSVGSYGTDISPKITYVNGDYNLTGGAGLLVVTGTLSMSGNTSYHGLIMVIGQGIFSSSGGGSGQYVGSIFVANTNSHLSTTTPPYQQLATLGTPTWSWNGGGGNGIQYNSCWANLENDLHYMVVSSREEMY